MPYRDPLVTLTSSGVFGFPSGPADTGGSSSGYRLLLQELAFDALGVGFVGGNLCVILLLVGEIVGKGGMRSGRGEMLVFTHDVFRAIPQIVQNGYSMHCDSGSGNARSATANLRRRS